jgi:hypothetical protein
MRAAKKRAKQLKPVALTAEPLAVSRPAIGVGTLTVGEIADRLSALAPDIPASIERLRHWTREKLIVPVDQQHAGTGKHRRYAEGRNEYDGAILHALADAGMHVVSRPYVQAALDQARSALPGWLKNQKRPLFLVITHHLDPTIEPTVNVRSSVECDASAKLVIVVNLAQLYANVRS